MALPKLGMKSAKTQKKSMKSKRVSKVAHGRMARALVYKGSKEKTVGGLTKDMLMVNKRGKIVSKKANAQGKKVFLNNVAVWIQSVMEARSAMRSKGFVAINGNSLQGKALYVKARAIREEKRKGLSTASSSAAAPQTRP